VLTRRQLSAALVGLTAKAERRIAGEFADTSHAQGHRLRDGRPVFEVPRNTVRTPVVIVGGGIAGLSAAWWLDKHRMRDYVVLEMEGQAGGNSRWGEGEAGPYPWAAHYVPVPGKGATLVHELFEELKLSQDGVWEERHLCHSPQERLFVHGRWQEGLEPELGIGRADRDQYRRFDAHIEELAASGEFRIPLEAGSCRRADLDALSFEAWLTREGLTSSPLKWYADYACRDDYGAPAAETSAWAGLHYFAARRETSEKGPLTWPEGNGWVARRLIERVGRRLRTGEFVSRIEPAGRGWRVQGAGAVYLADAVIFAAPSYLLPYLFEKAPVRPAVTYSPWLTANLTLDRWPAERGLPVAWDNVIYRSRGLGYVVSTHQSLRTQIDRTVWTYYWALADATPVQGRKNLLERDWHWWSEAILHDLTQAHPDIRSCVTRIDIMRFGHAMARPTPGFLGRRGKPLVASGLVLANSDLSGLSIFEEAQYRGVEAARAVLKRSRG
jgi:glycine/D-amino acid oxidase-like deaminating enzyme